MIRVVARRNLHFDEQAARESLRDRLGQVPRRMGRFAELALAGALTIELPPVRVGLLLGSPAGPLDETFNVLDDVCGDAPVMPFDFLQSQAGIALAVLAAHLPHVVQSSAELSTVGFWLGVETRVKYWLSRDLDAVLVGHVDPPHGTSVWALFVRDDCTLGSNSSTSDPLPRSVI